MNSPAFQFYAADYLADENVALMTLEEEGAYIRALAYCWREGSLPADNELLSRLLKGASNQTLTNLRKCFKVGSQDSTRLFHSRLEKEREKQRIWKEKSAEAGRRSGKVRKEKKLQIEPILNQPSNLVEPKSNSSSSSSKKVILPSSPKAQIETIYGLYPRKVGKVPAFKAIDKALRTKPFEELLLAVQAFARKVSQDGTEPQFIPHPATWFNAGRWDDEELNGVKPKRVYVAGDPANPADWLAAQVNDEEAM